MSGEKPRRWVEGQFYVRSFALAYSISYRSVGRVLTSPELIKLREARVVDVEFSLVFAVEAKV